MSLITCFFFFKQKTAYEMRISDWSSDVCSSDLAHALDAIGQGIDRPGGLAHIALGQAQARERDKAQFSRRGLRLGRHVFIRLDRSEEHTSELQSLMRISYAVFCLKKKNMKQYRQNTRMNSINKYRIRCYIT